MLGTASVSRRRPRSNRGVGAPARRAPARGARTGDPDPAGTSIRRTAVLHDLDSGRGRVRTAFAARGRRRVRRAAHRLGRRAIAGSAIYARWRALSPRALISIGAGALGLGFLVMATAPSLAPALIGAAAAGCGNGIEAVAARTSLQEIVEEQWMARIMSLNESMFQAVPGVGIILGGLLAGLANARVALAVAGWGALLVTAAAWALLAPSGPLGPSPPPPPDHESRTPTPSPLPWAGRSVVPGWWVGGTFGWGPLVCPARAPRLHRHRLEHDAAAGRGVRPRHPARNPSGEGVHPHRPRTAARRNDPAGEDRRGRRRGRLADSNRPRARRDRRPRCRHCRDSPGEERIRACCRDRRRLRTGDRCTVG